MTRLAMLVPTLDQIGGAERQVLLLAKEFSARGWQVTIVALSGNGAAVARELEIAGVGYFSLEMRKAWIDPLGWRRYWTWFHKFHPEILHSHLPHATFFVRFARLMAPVRVLVDTIHTTGTGSVARRLCYRLSDWLSTQVTCVSRSVAAASCATGIAPGKNLTILPNGVPIPSSSHSLNHGKGALGSFRWVAVGRLAPVKDYPTLLRAFAALPDAANLQISGSGPEEQQLRNLAAKLKIETRVQFLGFQKDISAVLANADAFVLSSLWEGLPISVLEASAAGLPVVATDASGTREAVLRGKTGFIVPVGDVAALTRAMAQVMTLPRDARQRMGENGRAFVASRFSLPDVVDRWEDLYSRLLHTHPCPTRGD